MKRLNALNFSTDTALPAVIIPADADIDAMGHVNNSVYLRWIEKAVHDHWTATASPTEFAAFLWIALRHEIDYRLPAHKGEQLAIVTALTEVRRARAWYRTEVRRDGALLIEALSCWGCFDRGTRRLTAIPPETASRILTAPDTVDGPIASDRPH